jgi:hypothetical protein
VPHPGVACISILEVMLKLAVLAIPTCWAISTPAISLKFSTEIYYKKSDRQYHKEHHISTVAIAYKQNDWVVNLSETGTTT